MPPSAASDARSAPEQWLALLRTQPAAAEAAFAAAFAALRLDAPSLGASAGHFQRRGQVAVAHYLWWRAQRLSPQDDQACCGLGRAELALGATEAARACFQSVLDRMPADGAAHAGIAECLLRGDRIAPATAAIARALDAPPTTPAAWHELALLALRAGAPALAARAFAALAQVAADDPSWWLARARFEREHGDAVAALAWVDRFGRLHPDDVSARLEKARCLLARGDVVPARRWLEKLESRHPGVAENSAIYGDSLTDPAQSGLRARHWVRAIDLWTATGDAAAARAQAQRLLHEQPECAAGWCALGRLEHAQSHWLAAEAAWTRALALDPAHLDAAAGLANLYEESNRSDEAAAVAAAGLAQLRPGEARSGAIELHLALAKAARRRKDAVAGLSQLAAAEALAQSDSQHEHIAFERGRLLESRHEDDAAFAAFTRGNALALAAWQRQHPGGNRYLAGIEAMLAHVGAGGLRAWAPVAGQAIAAPAFLVGFPRSGTSLLNHVLDGHDHIRTMEEKPPTQTMLAAVRAMPAGYPDAMARFDALDLDYLRERYFRSADQHGGGDRNRLLLDKFPLHINLAALIHRVFPQARFIFALRHPCDVVLSCFMQQFRLNHAMANFCTLQGAVALYTRTMDLWQSVRSQLPLAVHTIRYEDMVADFDGQVQALCDFLGVPWQPDLRRFSERARDRGRIDTPSYAQVSRPLYGEAVYRWQRYRAQLAPWLPSLQPYIERFGYA